MAQRALGIRDAIKVLLAVLSDCGFPHVPSETFRQAKYNEPEAKSAFCMILYCTLQILQYLQSVGSGDIRQTVDITQNYSITNAKMVYGIRKNAFELHYYRPEFYSDAESVGSCEFLLFFAWLLRTTSFMSQLCQYHVRAARDSSIPLHPSRMFLLQAIEEDTAVLRKQVQEICVIPPSTSNFSLETALQKLLWFKGMLKGCSSSTHNAHKTAAKLSHSLLHLCSSDVRKHHLSVHDLFLLRHPEQLTLFSNKLEWHVVSLQDLLQWQQHEEVFWQWMESVLDQMCKAKNVIGSCITTGTLSQSDIKTNAHDAVKMSRNKSSNISTHNSTTKFSHSPELHSKMDSGGELAKEVAMSEQCLHRTLVAKAPHIEKVEHVWLYKERNSKSKNKHLVNPQTQYHLSLPQVPLESVVAHDLALQENLFCHISSSEHLQSISVDVRIQELAAKVQKSEEQLQTLKSIIVKILK